jgi:N-acetylmuramidase-like protein
MSKTLTEADFNRAAMKLRCGVPEVKAVAKVESPKGGFLSDGRPTLLFEAHIFSRLTKRKYDRSHPHLSSRYWDRELYSATSVGEHKRMEEAAKLDRSAALQSASWGRFQLMGFNWAVCGFASLQDFVNGMYHSEGKQLDGFVAYVIHRRLDDELREHRWAELAFGYNGPAYAENDYDGRLHRAYKAFAALA